MTSRERENATLSFVKELDRGSVQETFWPWDETLNNWKKEGYLTNFDVSMFDESDGTADNAQKYLNCLLAEGVYNFEKSMGFDGVKRIFFRLPFSNFDMEVLEETESYTINRDHDGWIRKYYKNSDRVEEIKSVVSNREDWELLKARAREELDKYYTDENIKKTYGRFKEGHQNGDYSIRLGILGFFWAPRTLFGIENHMLAFYDEPQLMHDMNELIIQIYFEKLGKVLDILPADVIYISEDLSGSNGPMISSAFFDEFVGKYYRRLVPFLKEKGVQHIFVDTDGDFSKLIPNFIDSGIEGFLPMDVNAGMDIVEVRNKFPNIKLIGGFNKLKIALGKEAIDEEFVRILPVIKQGGFIPGCDHQVAPSTQFPLYVYYIERLKEAMRDAAKGTTNKLLR